MKALAWRCRRGMRELDQLLAGFLHQRYAALDSGRQASFVRLLDFQDPDIFGFLVRGETPADEEIADIVQLILRDTDTGDVRR